MNDHRCCNAAEESKKLIGLLSAMSDMMCFRCGVSLAARLMQVKFIPGDIVEFGCNRGRTAALMAAISLKKLWLYDSFQGLPPKAPQDITVEGLEPGALPATPEDVLSYFREQGLPEPTIIAKWFKDVTPSELPELISFAHLDGDYYDSIMDSLKLVYPRLSKGGICLIHDYDVESLQGVAPAVHDFLNGLQEQPWQFLKSIPGQCCIIR